jgi:hypothetical protein
MNRTLLTVLPAICLYTVAGCVSIPAEQISPQIRTNELSDHVHFLAQPALKGRKPRTLESQIARRYLTTRFTEYGLVPYPGTEACELPFPLGTNVIGLLPGSDPDVNDQIVILAAHYDHVGRTSEGVCLGACDNASGVAALLEIAEQISLADKRPRRSVCFASFDCEEQYTLGSLALTCQDYFDQSRVAAMLNIDLLGREFLGVVPNSLFVVGTEQYPGLRETVKQAGNQAGLNILPIGTDLVGPRGDHLAFETMLIPVLFFTCGIYKDYHQPTDTPDKLDYSNIKRSAQLVADTVLNLANADRIEPPDETQTAYRDELETLAYVLEKVNANLDKLEVTDRQKQRLQELEDLTHEAEGPDEYAAHHRLLRRKAFEALLPATAPHTQDVNAASHMACWHEMYSAHRHAAVTGIKKLVRHLLENAPSLFGHSSFSYGAYDLVDDQISFVEIGPRQYDLHVLLPRLSGSYRIRGLIFKRGQAAFSFGFEFPNCTGTPEEITDYCLLIWAQHLEDESFAPAWQKVMHTVTQIDPNWTYEQWLDWRLDKGGWPNEDEWLEDLTNTSNTQLSSAARLRRQNLAIEKGRFQVLLPLLDHLDDETPLDCNICTAVFKSAGPFADHPCVTNIRNELKKAERPRAECPTFADAALETLRRLTGQRFGKNKNAWRKWIEKHSTDYNEVAHDPDLNRAT